MSVAGMRTKNTLEVLTSSRTMYHYRVNVNIALEAHRF